MNVSLDGLIADHEYHDIGTVGGNFNVPCWRMSSLSSLSKLNPSCTLAAFGVQRLASPFSMTNEVRAYSWTGCGADCEDVCPSRESPHDGTDPWGPRQSGQVRSRSVSVPKT